MPRYLTHFELRIPKHPDTSILRTKRHILLSFSPLISPLVVSARATKYLRGSNSSWNGHSASSDILISRAENFGEDTTWQFSSQCLTLPLTPQLLSQPNYWIHWKFTEKCSRTGISSSHLLGYVFVIILDVYETDRPGRPSDGSYSRLSLQTLSYSIVKRYDLLQSHTSYLCKS